MSGAAGPAVSIVIATRDREWYLERALASVRAEVGPDEAEVIVVDGGSTDGTLDWLTARGDVRTIVEPRRDAAPRSSWGSFVNLGFRAATAPVVCMLSDDCLIVPGAIRNGLEAIDGAGGRVGAVAFYWRNWPEERSYRVGLTFGGRMFVNHGLFVREALAEVDFADEERFAFYHADGDLALRLDAAGWRCVDSPGSYVEHYSHANIPLRGANAARQPGDWAAYVERWGDLGPPSRDWIERDFADSARTAERYWGRRRRLEAELRRVRATVRNRLAAPASDEAGLAHDLDTMAGATAYNAWVLGRGRPWLHGRVLDVGAGIGTHALALRELADEVVALEPDPELAAILRGRAEGIAVVEAGVDAVEGPFDAIVCFNVLEHIPEDVETLRRLGELLAPGGTLLLLVPAHPALYGSLDESFGHERRYTRAELAGKLAEAGLAPVVLQHVNPVGALGWLMQAKIRRRPRMSYRGLGFYDRLVPVLRRLDRVPLPVGLSLWAVAKTIGSASASARKA